MNRLKQTLFKLFLLWPLVSAAALLGTFVIPAAADNLAQGFTSGGNLSPGMVVALSKKSSGTVIPATYTDTSQIYGVVIDPSEAPLVLNKQSGDQVFVASSGSYPVLVSTENGPVKVGDYLSMSTTGGIAAEASYDQAAVLGQAAAGFDGKSGAITTVGGFAVGKITVNIDPHKNPLVKNDVSIPPFLRKIGQAIAGKPVSALHIYLALAFLAAAVIISTALLTAAVRGAMIALGRNPLNRGHIMNSMFKVVIAAVMIFVIGLFGVYLLLKI